MYVMTSYNDLLNEIDLVKIRMEYINEQRELLVKLMYVNAPQEIQGMAYSDMPKGSGKNAMSLDRIIDGISRLDNITYIENRILQGMQVAANKIDTKIRQLEGIQYKVAYLHQIKGLTLEEVADELKYSHNYIRIVNARAKKNEQKTTLNEVLTP